MVVCSVKRGWCKWKVNENFVCDGCDMIISFFFMRCFMNNTMSSEKYTRLLTHAAFIFYYETKHEMYNNNTAEEEVKKNYFSRLISHIIN